MDVPAESVATARTLDEGFALLSDDFTYWSIVHPGSSFDKETLRAAIERRKELLTEVNIELLRCVNEGETVVIEGQFEATTKTGERYDTPFVCIFDTRDGLIVSCANTATPGSRRRYFPGSVSRLRP